MTNIPYEYIEELIRIARIAGDAIMEHYETNDLDEQTKIDSNGIESPVTAADIAAHKIIVNGLEELNPNIAIVSEEQDQEINIAASKNESFWLVDPLDGTKSFIKKDGEFTVNIALIINRIPVLGVVYAPAIDTLYFTDESGALRTADGNTEEIHCSDSSIATTAVASKDHLDDTTSKFLDQFDDLTLIQAGSSLKICRVAEGSAGIYPRLLPTTMEWDTAAADAVLRAAGGVMQSVDGGEMLYAKPPELRNTGFIAKGANISIPT